MTFPMRLASRSARRSTPQHQSHPHNLAANGDYADKVKIDLLEPGSAFIDLGSLRSKFRYFF